MKTMVSVVGTALLMSALAVAQTGSGTTGTSKSSKKKASTTSSTSPYSSTSSSSSSPSAQSGSTGASSTNSTSSGTAAGSSGFDSGLPQSDSSANAGTSGTSAGQSGSAAYGSGSGTTSSGTAGSSPSSSAQTGSSGSTSSTTQSGSSDEISNGPVAETVADSNAVIGWSTRSAASGTGVKYGTTRANMTETAQSTDGADGKNHHARLQGLTPSTRYYFQITENGQPVGGVGTFKTTASGETPVQSKAVIPQK